MIAAESCASKKENNDLKGKYVVIIINIKNCHNKTQAGERAREKRNGSPELIHSFIRQPISMIIHSGYINELFKQELVSVPFAEFTVSLPQIVIGDTDLIGRF